MRQTSLNAYKSIKDELPAKEKEVFDCISQYGPMTNQEISQKLNWPINCVTGRTNGLVEKGIVKYAGIKLNAIGRRVICWSVSNAQEALQLRFA